MTRIMSSESEGGQIGAIMEWYSHDITDGLETMGKATEAKITVSWPFWTAIYWHWDKVVGNEWADVR